MTSNIITDMMGVASFLTLCALLRWCTQVVLYSIPDNWNGFDRNNNVVSL